MKKQIWIVQCDICGKIENAKEESWRGETNGTLPGRGLKKLLMFSRLQLMQEKIQKVTTTTTLLSHYHLTDRVEVWL